MMPVSVAAVSADRKSTRLKLQSPDQHSFPTRRSSDLDRDDWIARRQEADKRRVVVDRRVATVDELRRRPGLAGDRVARNLRARRRAVWICDDAFHDAGERCRRLGRSEEHTSETPVTRSTLFPYTTLFRS